MRLWKLKIKQGRGGVLDTKCLVEEIEKTTSGNTLRGMRSTVWCGVANDSFTSLVTNRSGRDVHCCVGVLGSLTTRYVGHSRSV